MYPTSLAQLDAFSTRAVPPMETVRPGVFALALPMPDSRIPYSLCYVLEGASGDVHLIDSGIDTDENWRALRTALQGIGRDVTDVATLTVTHLHRDHAGLAGRLQSAAGTVVFMHEADISAMKARAVHMDSSIMELAIGQWAVPRAYVDELMSASARPVAAGPAFEGRTISADGGLPHISAGLRVVHTPGHTPGHITVVDEERRLLFAGDHVLPVITPGVGLGGRHPGDDPVGDHLASLTALAPFDDCEVCPGHGYRFFGLNERCAALEGRQKKRSAEIAALLAGRPGMPVWRIASQLTWAGGWSRLRGFGLFSALAQTAMHVDRL